MNLRFDGCEASRALSKGPSAKGSGIGRLKGLPGFPRADRGTHQCMIHMMAIHGRFFDA
jgi:hypothetical protein